MTARFANKTVVVTGGGKGIGRACVRAFANEGGRVMVVDRDGAAAAAVAQEMVDVQGEVLAFSCDVGRSPEVERLFAATTEAFGGTDILVNNAGVLKNGTVVEMGEHDWDAMFDVNVKAMFLTCKHAIPQMQRRGGGAIVNVASVSSFASTPASVGYSASKGAVVSFTRALAVDHASDNIRCNCVAPGSIKTPMLEATASYFSPDDPLRTIAEWGLAPPLRRIGTPEEVAKLILFLASDDASFCTGACYLIDGGLLAPLVTTGSEDPPR